ncbi:hypothetical protein [Burkholderia cenocepacia]|nr:hypothetical protein [Burkholderia cenocepacia]
MATLLSFDDAARLPAIEQAAGDDPSWVAACHHSYNTEFYLYDPVVPVAADWPAGRWFEDVKHLSVRERTHGVFYREFLQPFGLGSISGLYIHRGEGAGAFLSVQGGPEAQGLSDAQRRTIEIMGPHQPRAAHPRTHRRARSARGRRGVGARCGAGAGIPARRAARAALYESRRPAADRR